MGIDRTGRTVQWDYIDKWKQMVTSYSPKLWTAMSFVLPLMLIPLAAKAAKAGIDYAQKKAKK